VQTFSFFSNGRRREHTCEAVISIATCRTVVLEFIHSSLRCTLLVRRLVQVAFVLFFVPLSSNSRRVRPHIRFRRCTSSVGDVPPFVLTLLVGDTAGFYGIYAVAVAPRLRRFRPRVPVIIRRCLWSSLSGLTVLASVTLDSDDISSSPVAVVIVRRLRRLAISRIVLFYLRTFEHNFCVNHHHHCHHRVCTILFRYYVFITATLSLVIPLVITLFIATQLNVNSTLSWVELCRYKRALRLPVLVHDEIK